MDDDHLLRIAHCFGSCLFFNEGKWRTYKQFAALIPDSLMSAFPLGYDAIDE
ncbi:hypothetical protein PaeBR_02090 [Paenibacillus sp. BR2-3]